MQLSDEQKAVVNHYIGNAVVVAAAGSGKTRCLIERTANMIENGADPSRILLFTFTKKAAKEIQERIEKKLGEEGAQITICTIHSLSIQIIRQNYDVLGFKEKPTVWTSDKITKVLKNITSNYIESVSEGLETKIKQFNKNKSKEGTLLEYMDTGADERKDIAKRLHEMRMRYAQDFGEVIYEANDAAGDSLLEIEVDPFVDSDMEFKNTDEMEDEYKTLTENEQSMYTSINTDDPKLIRSQVRKQLENPMKAHLKGEMKPVPMQISGIDSHEYRNKILSTKENPKKWEKAVDIAMKVVQVKQSCNAIEFDDMVMGACRVLELDPTNEFHTKFQHVMVDEYQDVNDLNVRLINLLSSNSTSLVVVGDDDQAIYGFRGGNTTHILNFPKKFAAKTLFLTTNYRCLQPIVELANTLIEHNENRFEKRMIPFRKCTMEESRGVVNILDPDSLPDDIKNYKMNTQGYNADFKYEIFNKILEEINALIAVMDVNPNEIAILARNNFQLTQFDIWSKRIQSGFRPEQKVKFKFLSEASVFNNKTIENIHNWFNCIINPSDYVSLREALMASVDKFGDTSASHLSDAASLVPDGGLIEWANYIHQQRRHGPKTTVGKGLQAVCDVYQDITGNIEDYNVHDIFTRVLSISGLNARIRNDYKKTIENDEYYGDLVTVGGKENKTQKKIDEEFKQMMRLYEYDHAIQVITGMIDPEESNTEETNQDDDEDFFGTSMWDDFGDDETNEPTGNTDKVDPEEFYGSEGLLKWMDEVRTSLEVEVDKQAVTLGTIHSSKGKEWECVFIIDITDGVLPSKMNKDLEEERRLMYVGITRAKDMIYTSWPCAYKASPFVGEMFGG